MSMSRDVDEQSQRRSAKQAFNFWRRRLEERDILVFVVSGPHRSVELSEMRGFAIARPELPVIVINGKDYSQGGKAFTLLHEMTFEQVERHDVDQLRLALEGC